MQNFFSAAKKEIREFEILLDSVPSWAVSVFVLSVVAANLMANKELVSAEFFALDSGFVFSWIMFLCMDVICKRWGAKASVEISVFALMSNLFLCFVFFLISKTDGKWGAFYSAENENAFAVNDALNETFGGSWYVVAGSAAAFFSSSVLNAFLNEKIGRKISGGTFKSFAVRSFVSTFFSQFADNFIFALFVSKIFFGWTWAQVLVCSLTGAAAELLGEVIFSRAGWKIVCRWEKENVGGAYINHRGKK
jgi:uncharacterized PurR-regulated membrane protein YhhQ (DUF165 family)